MRYIKLYEDITRPPEIGDYVLVTTNVTVGGTDDIEGVEED